MEEEKNNKGILHTLNGEWRYEKFVWLILAFMCFVMAIFTDSSPEILIRDGAFHSSLLFAIMWYLSELRYKLIPEIRVG
jgi:hypothetical protein